MSDEIILEGRQYVSAKRASELSGYARDYVGQLARGGLIHAQRVGGLWYISLDSLNEYQQNATSSVPIPPVKQAHDMDAVVSFDGKDYISAARAAKLTAYNQDYIGQLARGGKIISRQIGNRWYVERAGLLAHKAQKDALLGAVQAEAVGLSRSIMHPEAVEGSTPHQISEPLLTYFSEDQNLMPVLKQHESTHGVKNIQHTVPIHIMRTPTRPQPAPEHRNRARSMRQQRNLPKISITRAAEAGVALTFVIVLSYGIMTLKDSSVYTVNNSNGRNSARSALTANAASALNWVGQTLEQWLSPQLDYKRAP
jgi:hypothetical protein